jgi:hypothetical protein
MICLKYYKVALIAFLVLSTGLIGGKTAHASYINSLELTPIYSGGNIVDFDITNCGTQLPFGQMGYQFYWNNTYLGSTGVNGGYQCYNGGLHWFNGDIGAVFGDPTTEGIGTVIFYQNYDFSGTAYAVMSLQYSGSQWGINTTGNVNFPTVFTSFT